MSNTNIPAPNPGSANAVALGCTCPIFDNCHGAGVVGHPGWFWFSDDCPVHVIRDHQEGQGNTCQTK